MVGAGIGCMERAHGACALNFRLKLCELIYFLVFWYETLGKANAGKHVGRIYLHLPAKY